MNELRLYADIKLNRPVDRKKDNISCDGYCFRFDKEEIDFDFEETYIYIDEEHPEIITIENRNPDEDAFKGFEKMTEEMLGKVTEITEFRLDCNEDEGSDLKPVELIACAFTYREDEGDNKIQIDIKDSVCETVFRENI